MTSEEWRPVAGYEGLYEVSTLANVRRVGQSLPKRQTVGVRGYKVVSLWKDNKGKTHYVHRLVATAFVPGDTTLTVNHMDGDCLNNLPSNLEWLSLADNTLHQHANGMASAKGCFKPKKIPIEDRDAIRRRVAAGEKQRDLAAEYGCSQPLISWICQKVMG